MENRHQGRGVSRTDAGLLSATAAPANRRLATFGRCFRPAVSDQLIDQAAIRRNVSEKPPHPLRGGTTTFDLGFGELGHVGHARMVSADQDPTIIAAKQPANWDAGGLAGWGQSVPFGE